MGWRSPPMRPVLPVPSSSCGLGWAAAWSVWGCWALRYPHWVSNSSCPGFPGNPGAPGSTDQLHPPPQIPVSLLGQRQLERDLLRRWRHVWRQYLYLLQYIQMKYTDKKYGTVSRLVFTLPPADVSPLHVNIFNVFLLVPYFYGFVWIFIDTSRRNMQHIYLQLEINHQHESSNPKSTSSMVGICEKWKCGFHFENTGSKKNKEPAVQAKMAYFVHCSICCC